MKKIERWARIFIITVGLLILGFAALRPAKTQEPMKLHAVEVGLNSVMPPGQVVGFACGAGQGDLQVRCFALVKE